MEIISLERAVGIIRDGMTVMIGGFMNCGTPLRLVHHLAESGVRGLTLISNDAAWPGQGAGALLRAGCVQKMIASHIGRNPEAGQLLNAGKVEFTLVPQGTLAERIRTGGAGLGGFLTPTGVGTSVEQGKQRVTVDGRDYLLELPLRAEVALLGCYQSDSAGNLFYRGAQRNMNTVMATAADIVIAGSCEHVDFIPPEQVHTPGLFVDYVVEGGLDGE